MRRWGCVLLGLLLVACGGGGPSLPATPTSPPSPTPTTVASATPGLTPTPLAAVSAPTATAAPLPPATLTPSPAPASSGTSQAVTVTAGSAVNLRSKPDTGADIVAQLPPGAEAFVAETDVPGSDPSSRWVRVSYQGRDGFIRGDLVGEPHSISAPSLPTTAPAMATATSVRPATVIAIAATSTSVPLPTLGTSSVYDIPPSGSSAGSSRGSGYTRPASGFYTDTRGRVRPITGSNTGRHK